MTRPDGAPPAASAGPAGRPPAPASWRTAGPGTVAAVVAAGVVAAAGLVWLLWAALGHASEPKAQLLGYEVRGRTVAVRFEVVKPADDRVRCVLRARDATGLEVARAHVTLEPGQDHHEVTRTLRATARPVSGELEGCHRL